MKISQHVLPHSSAGITHHLTSHEFGTGASGRKVYIQAGLHADEIPGLLVALTVREQLRTLDEAGRIESRIVVLSAANPVGLSQWVMGTPIGRFELGSGRNFNREYPMLHDQIVAAIKGKLTGDIDVNRDLIRAAWRDAVLAREPGNAFDALQQKLMLFAYDADVVLDLHCSREAAMHLYTCAAVWKQVEPLARYIGAVASLLGYDSGGGSYDEMQTYTWFRLAETFGREFPIPHGATAVTVEHRGQRDVSDDFARQDAAAIVNYLMHEGFIAGDAPALPELASPATPIEGSEQFRAPAAGILVHRAGVGERIRTGQALFDIVDPVSGERTTVHSRTEGVLYMRRDIRLVRYGDPLGRVSGKTPQRTGYLLSA
jgi:uncharacterized protein